MFEAREREFAQLADDRNFATPTAFRATLMWKVSRAYHHLLDRSRVSGDRFAVTHRIMLRRFGLGVTDMSVRPRFQISSSRLLDRGELSPSTRGDPLAQNGAWKIRWNASGSGDSSTTSPSTGSMTQNAPPNSSKGEPPN